MSNNDENTGLSQTSSYDPVARRKAELNELRQKKLARLFRRRASNVGVQESNNKIADRMKSDEVSVRSASLQSNLSQRRRNRKTAVPMVSWAMQQRAQAKELRRKQQEAKMFLQGYRAPSTVEGSGSKKHSEGGLQHSYTTSITDATYWALQQKKSQLEEARRKRMEAESYLHGYGRVYRPSDYKNENNNGTIQDPAFDPIGNSDQNSGADESSKVMEESEDSARKVSRLNLEQYESMGRSMITGNVQNPSKIPSELKRKFDREFKQAYDISSSSDYFKKEGIHREAEEVDSSANGYNSGEDMNLEVVEDSEDSPREVSKLNLDLYKSMMHNKTSTKVQYTSKISKELREKFNKEFKQSYNKSSSSDFSKKKWIIHEAEKTEELPLDLERGSVKQLGLGFEETDIVTRDKSNNSFKKKSFVDNNISFVENKEDGEELINASFQVPNTNFVSPDYSPFDDDDADAFPFDVNEDLNGSFDLEFAEVESNTIPAELPNDDLFIDDSDDDEYNKNALQSSHDNNLDGSFSNNNARKSKPKWKIDLFMTFDSPTYVGPDHEEVLENWKINIFFTVKLTSKEIDGEGTVKVGKEYANKFQTSGIILIRKILEAYRDENFSYEISSFAAKSLDDDASVAFLKRKSLRILVKANVMVVRTNNGESENLRKMLVAGIRRSVVLESHAFFR